MLSLTEYQAYVNDITILGQQTDQQIADQTQDTQNKQSAVKKTQSVVANYAGDFRSIMDQALLDIATNAYEHYQQQAGELLPEDIIKSVIKDQYTKRYYGATLAQRFVLMRLRLNRIANQTGQVGIEHLAGLFTKPFPFGAQTNISKRLLQGTTIKVEQDIAKKAANHADIPLIRWTLAKQHVVQCQCETYASRVDNNVKQYLRDNDLDYEPEGLYFVDDPPDPPHPNCQCEFNLVGDKEIVPSLSRRPFHRIRRLIRKLLRS